MNSFFRYLSLRPILRAIFGQLRPNGCWPLRQWICRQHDSEPGVTVIAAAAPVKFDPPDLRFPKEVAQALAQVIQPFPSLALLSPLLQIAQLGCHIQTRLTDGTPDQRPIVLIFEPKIPRKDYLP